VTAEAVKEAKREAKAARADEKRLATAGTKVVKLLERFEEGRRAAEELAACGHEARSLAERATSVGAAVVAIVDRMRAAGEALGSREIEMKEAEDVARQAAE